MKYRGDSMIPRVRQSTDPYRALMVLHAMIDARLFGNLSWIHDTESHLAATRTLVELEPENLRNKTELGLDSFIARQCNFELMLAFLGYLNMWDTCWVLEDHGLIEEDELDLVFGLLEHDCDPSHLVFPIVKRAYFQYFNPSRLLN